MRLVNEIHRRKHKYMFTSRQQKEKLDKFISLGTAIRHQIYIHEHVKNRLNSRNAYYQGED